MKTFLFAILVTTILTCVAYFVQANWAKRVLQARLGDEYQYREVFVNQKGHVFVSDNRVTDTNMEKLRLPLKYETHDPELIKLIKEIEGFGSKAKAKGYTRAIVSYANGGSVGGSTAMTSTAGSILGQRVIGGDIVDKMLARMKEEVVVFNMTQTLDEKEKEVLMSNELCTYGQLVGCTLVAQALWGRPAAKTFKERMILISSIRYPISDNNADRLVEYAKNKCEWLKTHNQIALDYQCKFDDKDFQKDEDSIFPVVTNRHIAIKYNLSMPNKLLILKKIEQIKTKDNMDIELSVVDVNSGDLIAIVSNNPYIVSQGGFNGAFSWGSLSKLLLLLDDDTDYGPDMIVAMGESDNDMVAHLANKHTNALILEKKIIETGLQIKHNSNLIHDAAWGQINGSSSDIHLLSKVLMQQKMPKANKQALTAAMTQKTGTLRSTKTMFDSQGLKVLLAKSGTVAVRKWANSNNNPEGVDATLRLFVLKNQQGGLYSALIRVHGKNGRRLCKEEGCNSRTMNELTKLAVDVLVPKKSKSK